MNVGITDLAHSIRKHSAGGAVPISLSHGQQLATAALGHKTLASFQASQSAEREPQSLEGVAHVIPDYELLAERASELSLDVAPLELRRLIDEAFRERLQHTRLHASYSAFEGFLQDQAGSDISEDADVSSASANANYDGIDEVYFELEIDLDQVAVDEPAVLEFDGYVGLGIDTERPYSGHKVNFKAVLTLTRVGRRCFERVEVEVFSAALDYGWSEPDPEDGPPNRTLALALADELDIELFEAEQLVDAEPQALTGSSGEMTYSYLFDFTDYASPALAAKLLAKHGSLQLEVGVNFFDDIPGDDWPN